MPTSDHTFSDIEFLLDFDLRDEALNNLEESLITAPLDIRAPLLSFVPNADSHQEKVIQASEDTIRIVAPAGSGKTQTILNRVLNRIRDGLAPERFLIVTFDNSAVSSLVSKLDHQLSDLNLSLGKLRIQTLNAFGYGLLKDYFSDEHRPVIQGNRQRSLMKEVKEELKQKKNGLDIFNALPPAVKDRFYLEFFSLLKNELFDARTLGQRQQDFADFMLQSKGARPFFEAGANSNAVKQVIVAVSWLFMAYERALQLNKLMDFDDQKLRAYIELRNSPSIRESVQGKYSEIIVDEFQDINRLDFALIKTLAERSVLVVTGDDDQAIYGFRNCSPEYIINLGKHLNREVASYELRVNYRNPANLVERATQLIQYNSNRIPKAPIANIHDNAEIKIVSSLSAGLEAKFIVSLIQKTRLAKAAIDYRDFAVLYRTNAQSLPIQVEFILNEIPYYVRERDNILANEVLDKLLGFLRLKLSIQNGQRPKPNDAVLTLKAYFRYLDENVVNKLLSIFQNGKDFFDALTSDQIIRAVPKIQSSNIISALQEAINADSLMDTLNVMAKRFKGLSGMIGSLEDVMEEKVPLGEIFELAANFKGNTLDFVTVLERALQRARMTGAGKDKVNGTALLTYFKSKGLQWHTVILTSCNDGIIPHKRAQIEDERRLFYVAMTRASSNLVVSYVKRACNYAVSPSPFISEAGLV
jgi:DNA helicase II / ATP-dependent DNA helicase PcrA